MAFSPPASTIEVIDLAEEQKAPAGADWIRLTPVLNGWQVTGNLPDIPGRQSIYGLYPNQTEARDAAIGHARDRGTGLLYIEGGH